MKATVTLHTHNPKLFGFDETEVIYVGYAPQEVEIVPNPRGGFESVAEVSFGVATGGVSGWFRACDICWVGLRFMGIKFARELRPGIRLGIGVAPRIPPFKIEVL